MQNISADAYIEPFPHLVFHNFYNDTVKKCKLIPIKSELVVGDKDYMLCGMVD